MSASTPCINVCVMDGTLCIGCGRTLDEIARWGSMSEAERLAIMETLAARLDAIEAQRRPPRVRDASR